MKLPIRPETITAKVSRFYSVAKRDMNSVLMDDCVMRVNANMYRGIPKISKHLHQWDSKMFACDVVKPAGECWASPRNGVFVCLFTWNCIDHSQKTVDGCDTFMVYPVGDDYKIRAIVRNVRIM